VYLKIESGEVIQNPTQEDLVRRLANQAFAVLGSTLLTYIQCIRSKDSPSRYFLEYQEGSTEDHYQLTGGPVPLEVVMAVFIDYLQGADTWRTARQWQKAAPLRARASGPPDKSPSVDDQPIVKYLNEMFGRTVRLQGYEHPTEQWMVNVASVSGRPQPHVTSYSTVGLWRWRNAAFLESPTAPRVEICGACATSARMFPNVLATAAFNVMREQWPCRPGSVLVGIVAEYGESLRLPHLYFTVPFLWHDDMRTMNQDQTVLWVLALPISEKERMFLVRNGDDALETLFQEKQIDIFNPERPSIV
jgi:antitoxin YqcF